MWTGTGDKVNLPTEINRRQPKRDEFRTPNMSQKKVKAMFCAAVWLESAVILCKLAIYI